MALKDWKKIRNDTWESKYAWLEIENNTVQGKKIYMVFVNRLFIKQSNSKSKAMKFAKNYMRKH